MYDFTINKNNYEIIYHILKEGASIKMRYIIKRSGET